MLFSCWQKYRYLSLPTSCIFGEHMLTMVQNNKAGLIILSVCFFFVHCKKENHSYPFEEYPWQHHLDAENVRLCPEAFANPYGLSDSIFIDCIMEGANLTTSTAPPKDEVLVFAYNIARGGNFQQIRDRLLNNPEVAVPDILLLSELDRGCGRTGSFNITYELAQALGMYYVYGVEYHEIDGACEHGNAILSRYPLGNVRLIRFAQQGRYYLTGGEGGEERLGGRNALFADVKIGEKILHVYSTHLEAYFYDSDIKIAQTRELAEDAEKQPFNVVVGGDMNSYLYRFASPPESDAQIAEFLQRGLEDTHASLPLNQRITTHDPIDLIIDLIFSRPGTSRNPGVGSDSLWGTFSDHLPVWAVIKVDGIY